MSQRVLRPAFLLALCAAALGAPPGGRAAILPFEASLTIQARQAFGVTVTGQGTVTLNASGGSGHMTAATLPATFVLATAATAPVTDPAQFPIVGLQLSVLNDVGVLVGSGGAGFGGVMPLLGIAKVCLFVACDSAPPANLSVPLSVMGLGGTATGSGNVVNVVGAPWTTGVVTPGLTPTTNFTTVLSGFVHGPASATSSTVGPGGAVRLVTPLLVSTNIAADLPIIPFYGILDLVFVPEPGTLLLIGTGAVLVLGGNRRRRAR